MSYTTNKEKVIPINLKNYINSLSIESTSINDVFTYINKDRVSKYYSLEAMRLDIEKDINMLNKIDMYSLEENIFQKFWEWVKKIFRKLVAFLKMIWQKIKNFFKGKKGEQVQKKAQELEKATSGVNSFDPSEYEDYERMGSNQEEPKVYMNDDYKNYNDSSYLRKFGKKLKTSFPIIKNQKIFENMKIPINYLLEEFYEKHFKHKEITPAKALHFKWNELFFKEDNARAWQLDPGRSEEPDLGFGNHKGTGVQYKREQLFFELIYNDGNEKMDNREIIIYDFFNQNDALIKSFINFMATTNLEKTMDKYDTSFLEKEIKNLQNAYKICLDGIQKTMNENQNKDEITTNDGKTRSMQMKEKIQSLLKMVSQFMTDYQDTLLRKCQLVYLFEEIIEKINHSERFK